jgi:hypothetical protein
MIVVCYMYQTHKTHHDHENGNLACGGSAFAAAQPPALRSRIAAILLGRPHSSTNPLASR